MKLTPAQADVLEARVDAISLSLQTLLLLLAREREGLRGRAAPEALEQVAEDKDKAVEQVARQYAQLREVLDGAGAGDSMPEQVAALRGAYPSLAERVDRLVRLTRECQQANHDNGVLVSAGLRHASRAMDTLRGVDPAADAPAAVYGRGARPAGAVAGARLTLRA